MKKQYLMTAVLLVLLLAVSVGCRSMNNSKEETGDMLEIWALNGQSFYVLKGNKLVKEGGLLSLKTAEAAEAGAVYRAKLKGDLAETYPPQAEAEVFEKLEDERGPVKIDFDTAKAILQHLPENTHLVDVRTPEEYASGYVAPAVNIPMDQLPSGYHEPKDDILIVYCRSGARSSKTAARMAQDGFKLVFDAGGIMSYKGDVSRP